MMCALESEAYKLLFKYKWPSGFICPRCSHTRYYLIRTRRHPLYECLNCRHQTTLQAGTVMEGSRTPLHKWAVAIQLISRTDQGTTAVMLQSVIGVTYKTAWSMLHKIRQAMSFAEHSKRLTGTVKGGMIHYCQPYLSIYNLVPRRSPIIIAAQVDSDNRPLHVKFIHIPSEHVNHRNLVNRVGEISFAKHHVSATAQLLPLYAPYFFNKLPQIKREFKYTRNMINKTFRGIGPKYLQAYLNECSFRRNLVLQSSSIQDRLLYYCTRVRRIPMRQMIISINNSFPTNNRFPTIEKIGA